jgi:hypothetical protein
MLETVRVQLYFGLGEVRYDPEGVDFTMFSTVVRDDKKPTDTSWEVITTWLYKAFSPDLE